MRGAQAPVARLEPCRNEPLRGEYKTPSPPNEATEAANGILTSILVHKDEQHFLGNAQGLTLIILTILFLRTAIPLIFKEEYLRGKLLTNDKILADTFGMVVIIGTIIPSTLIYLIYYSIGAFNRECLGFSGVCYATIGYTITYTTTLCHHVIQNHIKSSREKKKKSGSKQRLQSSVKTIGTLITPLFILTYILHLTTQDLTYLANSNPSISSIVHLTGLLTGLTTSTTKLIKHPPQQ